MRIVYLGTSAFAAAVLDALAATAHRPTLVVTRPDRPRGRGRTLAAPPVAELAHARGLALAQPASVNAEAARARIAAAAPDALVVCAFGALIKEPLLSDHLVLNVHPSLLPRWRGAAPIERAILAGDAMTGVCIMRLTAGLDTGPVARSAREPIGPTDSYGTLAERLQGVSARLLIDALDALAAAGGPGGLAFAEQPETGVTYADKIGPEDRVLDPREDAEALARRVRALTPHIGAAVALPDGVRLGVGAARPLPARPADAPQRDWPPLGELALDGPEPVLGCGGGTALALERVQPPGGRMMDGAAYLRGHRAPGVGGR